MRDLDRFMLGDTHSLHEYGTDIGEASWLLACWGRIWGIIQEAFINEAQQRKQDAFFLFNNMMNRSALETMNTYDFIPVRRD